MNRFTYAANAVRVVFGEGSLARVGDEIERLRSGRVLVLSTPGHRTHAERVADILGVRAAGVFDGAAMHVPIEIALAARAKARNVDADTLVAIGGGSTTGLAKAIALEHPLPIVAIPTTYAGSEATPIYGLTEGGIKRTGRDAKVSPKVILYDPLLTFDLPVGLTVASAMNAIAHAAEGLYAADRNPVSDLMAEAGIRAIASAIPRITINLRDVHARADCLYGAWLCGTVLGTVGMALHHKLCHALGGTFNLPHAQTHACMLPHALAYNSQEAASAMARIATAIGRPHAPSGLYDLAREHGATMSLRELGLRASDLDRAADLAIADPYANPRPLSRDGLRALLEAAWRGDRPAEA
ncbi:MAG TPA: maleylacetate reductase [Casimicrobiaceae bacterium]|nr:maleylacetate reductase [Casimicrobiaceae bacterium]